MCAGTAGRLNRIIKMASSVRKGGAVASILVRTASRPCAAIPTWREGSSTAVIAQQLWMEHDGEGQKEEKKRRVEPEWWEQEGSVE